jgi:yeast amino acid transporter
VYAFGGTEVIGTTVGKAANPRIAMPYTIRTTFFRIALLYIISVFSLGMLVPYNSKELAFAAKSSTCAAAPLFAIAIAIAQIARLGHVVNGCLLVFVFSAANSDLNIASRTLYDIAVDKKAPKIFTKTNKAGVPYVALGTSATFCLLAHMSRDSGAKVIFGYLTNMVAVCGMSALSAIHPSNPADLP